MQSLGDSRVLSVWFTFTPEGEQAWMLGVGDLDVEGTAHTDLDTFEPGAAGTFLGELQTTSTGCNSLAVRWQSETWPDAIVPAENLTRIEGTACMPAADNNWSQSLRPVSGAWFMPGSEGSGWFIEELGRAEVNVYWFGHHADGRQAWMTGLGRREGDSILVPELYATRGGTFVDSTTAELELLGDVVFRALGCNSLQIDARIAMETARPLSGDHVRLTQPNGAHCLEPVSAQTFREGFWEQVASAPQHDNQASYVFSQDMLWALGGVAGGDYDDSGADVFAADLDTFTWQRRPSLPWARTRPVVHAFGDSIYVAGDSDEGVYVLEPGANEWRKIAALPTVIEGRPVDYHFAMTVGTEIYLASANRVAVLLNPATGDWREAPIYFPAMSILRVTRTVSNFRHQPTVFARGPNGIMAQRYSFVTQSSEDLSPPPVGVISAGVSVGGLIWISGGTQRWHISASTIRESSLYVPDVGEWVAGPRLPEPKFAHQAVAIPGGVFVSPGENGFCTACSRPGASYVYRWQP